MIGHHVAKRARSFVKAATVLDADGFGRGDLHVVDVVAVPERLDDVVGKAEDHDVLHGLFAEVMIDAVDLLFGQNLVQFLIQLLGRFEIVTKRLFDDNARPMASLFFCQTALA